MLISLLCHLLKQVFTFFTLFLTCFTYIFLEEAVIRNHIEEILNYDGICEEQPKPKESPIKPKTSLFLNDTHKSKERLFKRRLSDNSDDDEEDEFISAKIARLDENARLERELRDLQHELMSQRLHIMERRMSTMNATIIEKDREIQDLKRYYQYRPNPRPRPQPRPQPQPEQVISNEATDKPVTKRKKVVAPRTKKPQQHQASIDQFMMIPYQPNQQTDANQGMLVELVPQAQPTVIDITQTAEFITQQNEILAQMEAELTYATNTLVAYTNQGISNIGVSFACNYRLSDYLSLLLEEIQTPSRNERIVAILNHPYIEKYKVQLMPNMSMTPQYATQQELARFACIQRQQVLNPNSVEVRLNLSALYVHIWFLWKAIQYAEMADAGELAYKPVILKQFEYSYAPEILRAWYPYFDAGNGYITMHDFKIPATPVQHGQGHGKHCHFCNFQYIAGSEGKLKHAHQVKNCDFIANMSNDERVILTVVLQKRCTSVEFNKHPFVSKYGPKSLLRRASAEELANGRFVVCPLTGDKLRINMRILLGMRQRCYTRFIERIKLLDTHDIDTEDKLKNLDAKPIAHQLDCFNHIAPMPTFAATTATAAPLNAKNNRTKKIQTPVQAKKVGGFLYKTLLDYEGRQFTKSKFTPDGKTPLRNFDYIEATGFGDSMYFSSTYDRVPPLYPVINAMPSPHSLGEQANAFFLQQQQQQQLFLTEVPVNVIPTREEAQPQLLIQQNEVIAAVPVTPVRENRFEFDEMESWDNTNSTPLFETSQPTTTTFDRYIDSNGFLLSTENNTEHSFEMEDDYSNANLFADQFSSNIAYRNSW